MSYDTAIQPQDPDILLRRSDLFDLVLTEGNALAVEGFTRLIQKWLKCFLTRRGTHPGTPEYGTSFPTLINGNLSTESQTETIVQESISQTNKFIRKTQNEYGLENLSERLQSANLVEFDFFSDKFGFEAIISIQSQADDLSKLDIPQITKIPG